MSKWIFLIGQAGMAESAAVRTLELMASSERTARELLRPCPGDSSTSGTNERFGARIACQAMNP